MMSSFPQSLPNLVRWPPVTCSPCCHAQKDLGWVEQRLGTSQLSRLLEKTEMENHVPLVSTRLQKNHGALEKVSHSTRKKKTLSFLNLQNRDPFKEMDQSWSTCSISLIFCRRRPGVSQTSLSKWSTYHSWCRRQWWGHLYGFLYPSLQGWSPDHGPCAW